jgi:glutathione S-transferase
MTAEAVPVLWHIKVSNYNEKARWALDHKRVPHRRRDPMPGAHMAIALVLSRRVATFPVLQLDGKAIGDSTRIIATLEERFPDRPLYPADAAQRGRALELEEFFDQNLGHDVRRVAFGELLREPDFMRSRAAEITTPRQGRVLAAALPAFAAMLRRRYAITERSTVQSLLKVRAAMRLIEDLLDGREHLVGDEFTVADLTGAALLAPLLGPPGFPYRDPSVSFPARLEEIAAELRALPAGEWVLRTYERHRPPSSEIGTRSPAEQ